MIAPLSKQGLKNRKISYFSSGLPPTSPDMLIRFTFFFCGSVTKSTIAAGSVCRRRPLLESAKEALESPVVDAVEDGFSLILYPST